MAQDTDIARLTRERDRAMVNLLQAYDKWTHAVTYPLLPLEEAYRTACQRLAAAQEEQPT